MGEGTVARDMMRLGRARSHLGVRRVARVWLVLVLAASAVVIAPAVAGAHAFLVRTSPQAGERLEQSPPMLTLQFSEPVVPGAEDLSVRTADGRPVALPWTDLAVGRTAIRSAFPAGAGGVYVVSWRVLAEDGHVEAGEFAFGVGQIDEDYRIRRAVIVSPGHLIERSFLYASRER